MIEWNKNVLLASHTWFLQLVIATTCSTLHSTSSVNNCWPHNAQHNHSTHAWLADSMSFYGTCVTVFLDLFWTLFSILRHKMSAVSLLVGFSAVDEIQRFEITIIVMSFLNRFVFVRTPTNYSHHNKSALITHNLS